MFERERERDEAHDQAIAKKGEMCGEAGEMEGGWGYIGLNRIRIPIRKSESKFIC